MKRLLFFGLLIFGGFSLRAQTEAAVGNIALAFDGAQRLDAASHVQFASGQFESSALTIEMLIRPTGSLGNRCVYSAKKPDGTVRMSLHVSTNGTIGIWNGFNYATVTTPVAFDSWIHVAFVLTSTSTVIYTNGVQRGTVQTGMSTSVTGTIPRIGVVGEEVSNENWRGGIDEIRIWSVARTSTQVAADMNDRSTTTVTNLLAYYNCDQGTPGGSNKSITTLSDRTTNARNGTLVNFRMAPFTSSNFVNNNLNALIDAFTGSALFVNGASNVSGNGSSWQSPFTSLSDALEVVNRASQNVIVHVAKGIYKPGKTALETFAITRNGIQLFGGYLGNESNLALRNPKNNETILSGLIGNMSNPLLRSLHVLAFVANNSTITNATGVDGFTIRDGVAAGDETEINGKTLTGRSGGAMLIDGRNQGSECSPVISNCLILDNAAYGYIDDSERPPLYVNGVAISINALNNGKASPKFLNSVFAGTRSEAELTVGAVIAVMAIGGEGNLTVSNCVFTDNSGPSELIYHDASNGKSVLTFNNNTVFDNPLPDFIQSYTSGMIGSINLTNNILLNGTNGLIDNEHVNSNPYVNYVLTNNIFPTDYTLNGNINTKNFSFFVDVTNPKGADGIWRTSDDGFNVKSCSIASNSGINTGATTTDITGSPRIDQTTIDRGAYEGKSPVVALSTTAVNNQAFVAAGCPGDLFTPYTIPGQPANISIAIAWGQNTASRDAAVVTINTETTNSVTTATGTGTAAMRRYWNVNLNGVSLTAPVSLRFYYDAADTVAMKSALSSAGAVSDIRWVKTNGTAYLPSQITPSTVNNSSFIWLTPSAKGVENGIAYVEFSGITSFSGGGAVAVAGGALPVKVTAFKAKAQNCSVNLDWSVADAVNFTGYEVERSASGAAYTQIGKVAHNTGKTYYSFTDASLVGSGKYLYRLKLVDVDGKFVYSDVLSVESSCNGVLNTIVIAPNPVRSELTIQFNTEAKNAVVNIRSMAGTLISSTKVVNSTTLVKIPVASLHSGIYLVELNTAAGKTITQKIVKQ